MIFDYQNTWRFLREEIWLEMWGALVAFLLSLKPIASPRSQRSNRARHAREEVVTAREPRPGPRHQFPRSD